MATKPKPKFTAPPVRRDLPGSTDNLAVSKVADSNILELDIDLLQPDPYQPRRTMDEDTLQELANSIRAQGLMQPIHVREANQEGVYTIIFGERRWRASRLAGLARVPVLVRAADEKTVFLAQIVENVQREDVPPLEEAKALQRCIDDFGMKAVEIANETGKSEAHISNMLALLKLPEPIREAVEAGHISDTTVAADLGRLHRNDPVAATAFVEEAKAGGEVTRAKVRDAKKEAKEAKGKAAGEEGKAPAKGKTEPAKSKDNIGGSGGVVSLSDAADAEALAALVERCGLAWVVGKLAEIYSPQTIADLLDETVQL